MQNDDLVAQKNYGLLETMCYKRYGLREVLLYFQCLKLIRICDSCTRVDWTATPLFMFFLDID